MTRAETIQEVFDLMGRTKRTMKGRFHTVLDKLELSPTELELLMTIQDFQPISHKALAERLRLTPGAVSQLLDAPDRGGYIVRSSKPSDRRVSYLSISRTGSRKLEEFKKMRQQMLSEAFAVLSDEELTAYAVAQKKIIEWFETH